jgi:hypothetical protein
VPPLLGADKATELATEYLATELAMEYLTVCTALAVPLTSIAPRLLVKPELHR